MMGYMRVLLLLLVAVPILVYIQVAPIYPDRAIRNTKYRSKEVEKRTQCKPEGGGRVDVSGQVIFSAKSFI